MRRGTVSAEISRVHVEARERTFASRVLKQVVQQRALLLSLLRLSLRRQGLQVRHQCVIVRLVVLWDNVLDCINVRGQEPNAVASVCVLEDALILRCTTIVEVVA